MPMPDRLNFGIFLAPFHRLGEDPTLGIERDLELIEWLDKLGYDEAWIGEHHSGGWETIESPEIFIAVAAERTRRIRLGTGVVSLPYHHPLMVAGRIVLLDHLTRGRVMLGVGPGATTSDSLMLGIDPAVQRPRMDEAIGILLRLFTETEPITHRGEWFELHNARLQLRPYTRPHPPLAVASAQSPSGMLMAGKYGIPPLSVGVRTGVRGPVSLPAQWQIAQDAAAKHGRTLRREDWRIVMPVYLAESRREAIEDAREGCRAFYWDYFRETLGFPIPDTDSPEKLIEMMMEAGVIVVGTPDDCVDAINRLGEMSGGFGTMLITAHEWASREKILRSFELIARYVRPRFQGSLAGLEASQRWVSDQRREMFDLQAQAIEKAHQQYDQAASGPPRRQ